MCPVIDIEIVVEEEDVSHAVNNRLEIFITILSALNHYLVSGNRTLSFCMIYRAIFLFQPDHAYHLLSCSLCPVDTLKLCPLRW